jgi:hypothetical protein
MKKKTIEEVLRKLSDLYEFNREIRRFKFADKGYSFNQPLQRTAASRRL